MPSTPIPPIVQALCDSHVLVMRSHGLINHWLDRYNGNPGDPADLRILNEAARLADLSARLMGRRLAVDELWRKAAPLPGMRDIGLPAVSTPVARRARPRLHAASGLARGRLNNGNPSGDFLQAPRCGARTRAGGCCRQPAMGNGRCRMHGGLSTGPRTPAGLRRSRYSRYVHGFRGRPVLEFRRRCVHTARQLRDLAPPLRRALRNPIPAGHGLLRPDFVSHVGAGFKPAHKINHRDHRKSSAEPSDSGSVHSSSVSSVFSSSSVLNLASAGHGLHRSESVFNRTAMRSSSSPASFRAHLRSSASICGSKPSFPAGQGVHRSESDFSSVLTYPPFGRKVGGNKRAPDKGVSREGIRAA
jgi:hypothetical protein